MTKIKVAQIGTSEYSHGKFIFESLKKQSDIFDIVGYVLPENEREKFSGQMGIFDGYKEMTVNEALNNPEIDAIFVETEEAYLTKYALMAAEAKKHIHMEKPGGLDTENFSKLIKIVKENQTVFHTGYMYRYNPVIKKLIDEVSNGEFGDIISVEAQMNAPYNDNQREWLKRFSGGMMFFLGCHLIDLILQIQGTPEKIIPLNKETGKNGVVTKDFGMVVLEYKNGVSFAKTNAAEAGGFVRRQLVITGTKKTVELKPLEIASGSEVYTNMTTYTGLDWHNKGVSEKSVPRDRYDDMTKAFAEMVRGEIQNPYTYDYELELYNTLTKCI